MTTLEYCFLLSLYWRWMVELQTNLSKYSIEFPCRLKRVSFWMIEEVTPIFGLVYLSSKRKLCNDVYNWLSWVVLLVTEPPRKKAKKDHIAESVGDEEAFHIQNEREYEDRLHREAREEQKEERTSLMAMWKEMMEFQGNLLKEFIHHPSRPTSGPYHKHDHYNQRSSSFPNTSYTAPYDSPG